MDEHNSIGAPPVPAAFEFTYEKPIDSIRVTASSTEMLSRLVDVFTVDNPQYFFLQQKGGIEADETFSAITPLGSFRTGLFPLVYNAALRLAGGDRSRISIPEGERKQIADRVFPLRGMFEEPYEVESPFEGYPLRWYQRDAVAALMSHGRGIVVSPTGSGKSLMIATLVSEIRKRGFPKMGGRNRILLVVPTRQLVDQMAKDFEDYGLGDVCRFTSDSGSKRKGTFTDNSCSGGFANLIVTNHAWILEKHGRAGFPKNEIGCVIADEVHTVRRGTKILRVMRKFKTPLRFGFTATLPEYQMDRWVNFGMFGMKLFDCSIARLQGEGYLSRLRIVPIRCRIADLNPLMPFSTSDRRLKLGAMLPDGTTVEVGTAYSMELAFMEECCRSLWRPVFEAIGRDFDFGKGNMVVLFDRTAVGRALVGMLGEMFPSASVHFIDGSVDVADREETRSGLEASSGNILVAQTVTASVGLNVKNLHGIVFAFSGRSHVRVVQSIGRVIRKNSGKTVATLYEVWYNTRYSTKHHQDKVEILTENYGPESFGKTIDVEARTDNG